MARSLPYRRAQARARQAAIRRRDPVPGGRRRSGSRRSRDPGRLPRCAAPALRPPEPRRAAHRCRRRHHRAVRGHREEGRRSGLWRPNPSHLGRARGNREERYGGLRCGGAARTAQRSRTRPRPTRVGAPDAPALMPAYLDLWSQTSPPPAADPEVGLFSSWRGGARRPASPSSGAATSPRGTLPRKPASISSR